MAALQYNEPGRPQRAAPTHTSDSGNPAFDVGAALRGRPGSLKHQFSNKEHFHGRSRKKRTGGPF